MRPDFRYSSGMQRSARATGSLAFLTLTLGLGIGGCKDEETEVGGYVDSWSRRVCDAVVECSCDYPGGSNYDHCLQQLGVGIATQSELNDVEGLRFDGECADRQVSEIGKLGCGVFMPDPDAECQRPCKVWVGPMGEGATCTSVNGVDNCHQGLVCGQGVCVNPCAEPDLPAVGEPCASQFGCEEGAWCDDVRVPLLPTCATLPLEGQTCLGPEQGFACNVDLICDLTDPDAPVCASLPGEGEECPTGSCAEDLFCDNTEVPAVCVTPPSLGDLCPQGLCAAPNLCEAGLCVEPRPQVCGFYGGVPEGLDPTGTGTGTGGPETTGPETTGPQTGGAESTGGVFGDCLTPSDVPGCNDAAVVACVCEFEAACCTDAWSELCVEYAVTSCGA